MRNPPFSQPPPFTSWGLVLDGDVHVEAGSNHGDDVRSTATPSAAAQHTVQPPVRTPGAVVALHGKAGSARAAQSETALRLDDWERAAVEVYREVRRYRDDAPPRRGSGGVGNAAGVPSDDSGLPRLAAFIATAFPQLLEQQTSNDASTREQRRSNSLLLQYFLQVGYPARAHGVSATSAAALIATAAQTASWFTDDDTECEASAAEACDGPVRRSFPAGLLPDVALQTIGAHRMRPATAAAWLLRVFTGLLGPEEARECRARNAVLQRHGQPAITTPDPTMPVTACVQALRHWAVVVSAAVYQVQAGAGGGAPANKATTTAAAAAAVRREDGDGRGDRRADGDADWRHFSLVVLRPAVTLLLRACLDDACAGPLRAAGATAAEADAETLLPPPPATRVGVDGLARLALTLCQHAQFPSRAVADAGAADVDAQKDMTRKHWEAYTQPAVQQLPCLPPHYGYLVPILDHVLSV